MTRAKVQAGGVIRKSIDTTWRTPEYILACARVYFGGPIPFDPATGTANPTNASRFCAGPAGTLFAGESLESKNGLEVDWAEHGPVWVNPPFSKEWTVKIGKEAAGGAEIVALLPCNRFETDYMHETLARAEVVCWVNAKPFQHGLRNPNRIAFISNADGQPVDANPYASMILGFNVDVDRFAVAFKPLGLCQALGAIL